MVLNGSHPAENRQHRRAKAQTNHDVVSPEAYARWRRSTIGSLTGTREREVIFNLMGSLEGQRLLDMGCGDGVYLVEGKPQQPERMPPKRCSDNGGSSVVGFTSDLPITVNVGPVPHHLLFVTRR